MSAELVHHQGRVLYASHGYTTHDRRFMAAAAEQGWAVDFVRCDGLTRTLEARDLPEGVTAHDWLGTRTPLDASNQSGFVEAFRQLEAELRPDVVHAGPVPTVGLLAVKASKAPVIVMSWASDLLIDAQRNPSVQRDAEQALGAAAAVVVDCEAIGVLARSLGASEVPMLTMPWGVDLEAFSFDEPDESDVADGPIRLLSLRSFEPVYDMPTVLHALQTSLRDCGADSFRLTLAGSGTQEQALRGLATELGIGESVAWAGRVAEDAVAALIHEHHLCVSAALSDGSSISLLQAMAAGRPSIVTDLDSNREWVSHGVNGLLFAPTASEALAAELARVWADRSVLASMARAGRLVVEQRADWSVHRRRLVEFYDTVANRPSTG